MHTHKSACVRKLNCVPHPMEWNAREEGRIVLPDSDFERLVDELEKPAKPLPRLRKLARK
jgi:hypothetical protein